MKKSILLLLLFFFALSLFAQEPIIKFYMNDGSHKQYNISDLEKIDLVKGNSSTIIKVFYDDSLRMYYPTASIDSIKIENDSLNRKVFAISVFGASRQFFLEKIDSINFKNIDTKISNKSKYLDSLNLSSVIKVDSTKLYFEKDKINLNNLGISDFLLAEITKFSPNGMMRKVTQIDTFGDTLIITTENALITDIIERGIIYVHKNLTPNDTIKTIKQKGVTIDKILDDVSFNLGIQDFEPYSNPPFYINMNGYIELNIDFGFYIYIDNWTINQLLMQFSSEMSLNLYHELSLGVKIDPPIEVSFFKTIFAAIPTGIPLIFVTPGLDIKTIIEAELTGGVEFGINPKINFHGGFEYNNGNVTPFMQISTDLNTQIVHSVNVEAEVKARFGPQLNVNINGMEDALNAYVNLMPYGKLEADLQKFPCWDILFGIESRTGLSSKWAKKEFELKLIDINSLFMKSAPYINSIQPNNANIGDIITINGTCFGDNRTAESYVFFNQIAAIDFISWSNNEIKVKVPQGATTGKLSIDLKDAFIDAKSNEVDFKISDNSTPTISSITPTSAKINDIITIKGINFGSDRDTSYVSFAGIFVTEYTSWNDTVINVIVPKGATTGKVSVTVNGIKSNEVDFTVKPSEPEDFESVTIGTQTWMKKNLDVDHYRNGDPIPQVTDQTQWANLTTGAWCYYDNDPANGEIYRKLYNWYAVNDPRGLAPDGWHVPSNEEWTILTNYLGGSDIAGGKLKEAGIAHWISPNNGATNESGFTALPSGVRNYNFDGLYMLIGFYSYWWSSTKDNWDNKILSIGINSDYDDILNLLFPMSFGISVRCVKDNSVGSCTIAGTTYDSETTEINVANMELTELPDCIGGLINLEKLDAWNNNFTELPASIGSLINLEILSLADNSITSLPESIKNLSNNLKILDLENNPITDSEKIKIHNWLPNTVIYW